ncbi:MAG: M15 family metallopeptidase [Methyloceanibacter sp.]|nr:M15 family metallopeptidase [Methyloceanibacter sp.]
MTIQSRPGRVVLTVAVMIMGASMSSAGTPKNTMPDSFVYLRDVDPTIQQDMRYFSSNNFTRQPVPGYDAPECVLVREAAEALKAAQADLKPLGYALKVYDCYRPAQSVAAFVEWSSEPDDPEAKRTHYPNLTKGDLFPKYIATRSGHSRGATLDLTIVPIGSEPSPVEGIPEYTEPCTEGDPNDNGLDMGTGFDCFDPKANTVTKGLTPVEQQNRDLLLDVMSRHGFKNYPKEIWHFTFQPEPFPDTYFDFPILPHPGNGPDTPDKT